jgi:hypothetical protein
MLSEQHRALQPCSHQQIDKDCEVKDNRFTTPSYHPCHWRICHYTRDFPGRFFSQNH